MIYQDMSLEPFQTSVHRRPGLPLVAASKDSAAQCPRKDRLIGRDGHHINKGIAQSLVGRAPGFASILAPEDPRAETSGIYKFAFAEGQGLNAHKSYIAEAGNVPRFVLRSRQRTRN